jgi:hypothetical protein
MQLSTVYNVLSVAWKLQNEEVKNRACNVMKKEEGEGKLLGDG